MSTEKADALVLRVIDFSETSNIVTLLTREFGKVHALAKGGRRLKGPFESALDLLSECRVVFLRKSSEALDLLTEAKLEKRFRGRRGDLMSLYAGYYVAELLSELTHDLDPHPELYDTAVRTLAALSGTGAIAPIVLRFELLALHLVGHAPSWSTCVGCGTDVEPVGRVYFGHAAGGVLCGACRAGRKNVVSVSAGAIRVLAQYAEPESEDWSGVELPARGGGEIRALVNHYLCHVIGRRPRMHAYLGFLSG